MLAAFLLAHVSTAISCVMASTPVTEAATPCHESDSQPAKDALCAAQCAAAAAPVADETTFVPGQDSFQARLSSPTVGDGIRVYARVLAVPDPAPPPRAVPRRILLHSFLV
jgi:hypothetical protein